MSIDFEIIDEGTFLRIVSTGTCEHLGQLKDYVLAIHHAVVSSGAARVLVDESRLAYQLSTLESFHSGRFVATLDPKPKRIAVVSKPEGWQSAKFWETVAVNRGVLVQVFRDVQSAEDWILPENGRFSHIDQDH